MMKTRTMTLSSTPQLATLIDDVLEPTSICIQNTHATAYAYVGTEFVTTTDYGFRLRPGASFIADINVYDKLYLVGDTGCTVAIVMLEQ